MKGKKEGRKGERKEGRKEGMEGGRKKITTLILKFSATTKLFYHSKAESIPCKKKIIRKEIDKRMKENEEKKIVSKKKKK